MPTAFDLTSSDGTVLRAWRNDASGPPVIVSNGLGAVPEAWPGFLAPDSGYAASTWFYRGTFGSQRPADPRRIRVEDHVEDLLALMDALEVEKALVVAWSIGVNVAFEAAQRHPDRVAGLMSVAGVPGGTFASMGAPLGIPRRLRHRLALRGARNLRLAGPLLTAVARRIPVNERTAWLAAHSGFLLPQAKPELLVPMLREFLQHDWKWYAELAVAASEHEPMDLGFVQCPTTLVAGRYDVLTSMEAVLETAKRIPHAQVTVLPGSHFLPVEYPELLHAALDELAVRTGLSASSP